MEFLASAALFKDAGTAYKKTSAAAKRYLLRSLSESAVLSSLPITIRYVSIIMPDELRDRYPPRFKLRTRERLYDCAPQLSYEIFISGTFEQQIDEYMRGLEESVHYVEELGATDEQIAQYEAILREARIVILRDELDQTRH